MYNLFIAGSESAWDGSPWYTISRQENSRWLSEFTDDDLSQKYRGTSEYQVSELQKFPCVFAYEKGNMKNPRFGVIKNVSPYSGGVKIEYEIQEINNFISYGQFESLSSDLDIEPGELYRTHWALKNVDLSDVLSKAGVILPHWARIRKTLIDISNHNFEVALSFPGEVRDLVLEVSAELERLRGLHTYFYDDNYKSQIARPNVDSLLHDIYGKRSDLVVVFLSSQYQFKNWCGLEFRVIREKIFRREHKNVMFVRTDDGEVDGVFQTDGYIDSRTTTPKDIASMISERVDILQKENIPDI